MYISTFLAIFSAQHLSGFAQRPSDATSVSVSVCSSSLFARVRLGILAYVHTYTHARTQAGAFVQKTNRIACVRADGCGMAFLVLVTAHH